MEERRSGPDSLIKFTKILSFICSSLLVAALLLVDRAKPRVETFFDRLLDVQLDKGWDHRLLSAHLSVVITIAFLSLVGLFLNRLRTKRKTDTYSKSLILSILFCLASAIFYLVFIPH